MDRDDALDSITLNVENENLVKHMLAAEAVMRALAQRLGKDEDEWGLTGLLHDIDVELTGDDPGAHGMLAADIARELGASRTMAHAIICHNQAHGLECETELDSALLCADPLTGLITAAALIRPDKKLSGVTLDSLRKRFKEKRFAAGVERDQIARCHDLGLEMDEFLTIGLKAMQNIAGQLEL